MKVHCWCYFTHLYYFTDYWLLTSCMWCGWRVPILWEKIIFRAQSALFARWHKRKRRKRGPNECLLSSLLSETIDLTHPLAPVYEGSFFPRSGQFVKRTPPASASEICLSLCLWLQYATRVKVRRDNKGASSETEEGGKKKRKGKKRLMMWCNGQNDCTLDKK